MSVVNVNSINHIYNAVKGFVTGGRIKEYSFDSTHVPPIGLFLTITNECNMRCKQCHFWMSKDPSTSLDLKNKLRLLDEFHQLNPNGCVCFCGGETMKKTDEFFALTGRCRDLSLDCCTNTNASFIRSPEIAEKLVLRGPNKLIISLDSMKEEVHDYIRGIPGTYKNTLNAISMLREAKKKHRVTTETLIHTNTIVMDLNYRDLREYIEFAKGIGIEGVMFQMLSHTFFNQAKEDWAFNHLMPKDKERFKHEMDMIIKEHDSDPFVLTSKNDFEWMKLYIDNPDFIGEQVCGSHERNIMVDINGDVQLCFSMRDIMGGKMLGNIHNDTLKELWTSPLASEARRIMNKCKANCGMLNCHRKIIV